MKKGADGFTPAEKEIYSREFALLENINRIAENQSNLTSEELLKHVSQLGNAYDRLFRTYIKTGRISDANQRKLLHMLELERQNVLLEQQLNERTREIQDKNKLLEEQSKKLRELDQAKSRFFSNISHEFRTPLTLIMGPLQQVIDQYGEHEPEGKRKLIMIYRNAQRLMRLIDQLLDLAKLDSGKLKLNAAPVAIVPFLKGMVPAFRLLAQQKELEVSFQSHVQEKADLTDDLMLYIDTLKMEDIMSNLLINAVKFTPPGGLVTVELTPHTEPDSQFTQGFVEISVLDTGPCIHEEQLHHIFDRFYHAEDQSSLPQKSTGIGLALVKELVELHYGTITAGSCEQGGNRFTIRLPLGKDHLKPEEIQESPRSHSHHQLHVKMEEDFDLPDADTPAEENQQDKSNSKEDIIILIVEDNADMRSYIKDALRPGYKIIEAVDGNDGVKKAEESIPDLIVSDVLMPGMDGFELCRRLKSGIHTSHIPIILLTAKASREDLLQGLELGADDYITKPFSTDILNARIKNLVELRRHLQMSVNREMTRQPVSISVSEIDKSFIKRVQAKIEENLDDPDLNVEHLCNLMSMSRPTLYRKLMALTGESPTEFIRSYRLKRASQMLENGAGSVTEIAFEVGFSSRTYFTKCFKDKFQQLPSAYLVR